MKSLVNKIYRFFFHLRLQPISVFCFHQVSDVFDSESMWECDWMSTMDFKDKINKLQGKYTFISISEAYDKMKNDTFRFKKYAVLTADDGSKTIECILPWLQEQHIPLTMFINGSYLDGKTYRETPAERYFTKEEISCLNMDNITFGHHSWNHKDFHAMTVDDFELSIKNNMEMLADIPKVVPFWAYPYGTHTTKSDAILKKNGFVPVYMDGQKNYNNTMCIHRELL